MTGGTETPLDFSAKEFGMIYVGHTKAAHEAGIKVGLCGQAPSDHPEFARFLVEQGIDSISLNPDSFLRTARHVAAAEREGAAV